MFEVGIIRYIRAAKAEGLRRITPLEICISSYHTKAQFNNPITVWVLIQNISTALRYNRTVTENSKMSNINVTVGKLRGSYSPNKEGFPLLWKSDQKEFSSLHYWWYVRPGVVLMISVAVYHVNFSLRNNMFYDDQRYTSAV